MSNQITHLLDTSAVLAYYLKESGWDVVHELVFATDTTLAVSSLTWMEFKVRLQTLVSDEDQRMEASDLYRALLGSGIPVDDSVVARALHLREEAHQRLPNADALIAATAAEHGAVLVHRDPHLAAIPGSVLPQLILPDKNIPSNP